MTIDYFVNVTDVKSWQIFFHFIYSVLFGCIRFFFRFLIIPFFLKPKIITYQLKAPKFVDLFLSCLQDLHVTFCQSTVPCSFLHQSLYHAAFHTIWRPSPKYRFFTSTDFFCKLKVTCTLESQRYSNLTAC